MVTNHSSPPPADLTVSGLRSPPLHDVAAAHPVRAAAAPEERSELVALAVIIALVTLVVWKLALHGMAVWRFVG